MNCYCERIIWFLSETVAVRLSPQGGPTYCLTNFITLLHWSIYSNKVNSENTAPEATRASTFPYFNVLTVDCSGRGKVWSNLRLFASVWSTVHMACQDSLSLPLPSSWMIHRNKQISLFCKSKITAVISISPVLVV